MRGVIPDWSNSSVPVVGPATSGGVYAVAGMKTLTAPTGAKMLQVEAHTGTIYLKPGSSGTLADAAWTPTTDSDQAELWYPLVKGEANAIREFAVQAGDTFRLSIPTDAIGLVFWYI